MLLIKFILVPKVSLARQIDCKIDDCYPKTGVLGNHSEANCITGNSYNTSSASQTCKLIFKLE